MGSCLPLEITRYSISTFLSYIQFWLFRYLPSLFDRRFSPSFTHLVIIHHLVPFWVLQCFCCVFVWVYQILNRLVAVLEQNVLNTITRIQMLPLQLEGYCCSTSGRFFCILYSPCINVVVPFVDRLFWRVFSVGLLIITNCICIAQ